MIRLRLIPTVLSLLLFSSALFAQVPASESLGDLARKAREAREKKASANTTFNNDSALPGTTGRINVGNAVSNPVASPASTPAVSPASVSGAYDLKMIPKDWPNCAAAAAELTTTNAAHTDHHWEVNYSGNSSESNGLWTFVGTTSVKSSISVSVPDWVNIPDAPSLRTVWNKMSSDLLKHEEGHVKIDLETVQQVKDKTITGTGPTQNAAQEQARQQFNEFLQMVGQENQTRQDQYDAITNHGRKQSAVGGTDVGFGCP